MPINKNAYRRYKVIDACLRNKMRRYPNMKELLAALEEKLGVNTTAETVQKDIAVMKMLPPDGFDAPIKFNRTHLGYDHPHAVQLWPFSSGHSALAGIGERPRTGPHTGLDQGRLAITHAAVGGEGVAAHADRRRCGRRSVGTGGCR